jgi:hypothetical protein
MIPLPLLQQLEDQNLDFVLVRIPDVILARVPDVISQYRWVCRIGPEGDNAIRGFGHSASEALSEVINAHHARTKYKSAPVPSDLDPA